jgi:hypothetical protein
VQKSASQASCGLPAARVREELEVRVEQIERRSKQLDKKFIYANVIDRTRYESHRDKLRQDLALAPLQLEDAKVVEIDVEGVLAFAMQVVGGCGRATADQKL